MLSTDDLRFFVVVAHSPTLAAAARTLNVSAPAVSQRLGDLEARLKMRLVERSARQLSLTGEGKLLAERGEIILADMEQLIDAIAARRHTVSGHLRVAASFGFGRRFVAPAIALFRRKYPTVTVELILSENPLRVGADSWDVMIHVGSLKDSQLIARKVAPNRRLACASPEYLQRHGVPSTPQDLRHHECIALYENDEDVKLWRFTKPGYAAVCARIDAIMSSNSGEVAHDWAKIGMGIIVRSEWDVAEDLRAGRLLQVLPDWELPTADVTALTSQRSEKTARVRQFMTQLVASLNPPPWQEVRSTDAARVIKAPRN